MLFSFTMLSKHNIFFIRHLSHSNISLAGVKVKVPLVSNWIDGKTVESKTKKWIELTNPVSTPSL